MCDGFLVTPIEFLVLDVLAAVLAICIVMRDAYRRLQQMNPIGALAAVYFLRCGLCIDAIVLFTGAAMIHRSNNPRFMVDCATAPQ